MGPKALALLVALILLACLFLLLASGADVQWGERHDLAGLRHYAEVPGNPEVTWTEEPGGSAGFFTRLTMVKAVLRYEDGPGRETLDAVFTEAPTRPEDGIAMSDIQSYPPPFAAIPTGAVVTFVGLGAVSRGPCSDFRPEGYLARIGSSGNYVFEVLSDC